MSDTYITMTAAQAAELRTPALDPRQIGPDEYVVPVAVLSDPTHAAQHEALSALPTRVVADHEWPSDVEDPE